MQKNADEQVNPVIQEISKRILFLNIIVTFVICSLILLVVRYIFPPVFPFLGYLPDVSISIIIALIIFLSLIGLYLSQRLSRQTVRIIHDYSNRLNRLLSITSDLRDEVHGDILLDKIMDYALSITNSEAGSLLLMNDDKKLAFKIVRGDKAPVLTGTTIEPGKGITGRVALTGKPLRVADAKESALFNPKIDAMTGFETKSILCVPLKTTTGTIGVLELLNKRGGHPYRDRDEEIICYLAEQAAISILKTQFLEDQKNYEIHLTDILIETIDFQQPEKRGHAHRVARYSNVMAKALRMTDQEKKRLYLASLLHDAGFLRINPEETYKKEVYTQHPLIGYELIRPITFYADIAPLILHHHQRYDGYGYPPMHMKGDAIPLESRIIAIAEAFDVMVNPSSYKVPMSYEDALHELQQKAGSQFDPRLVEIFLQDITPDHLR